MIDKNKNQRGKYKNRVHRQNRKHSKSRTYWEDPEILNDHSPFVYQESFKKLCTNINFMSVNNNLKKIIVTSAVPNEGKSSVAVNLAAILSKRDTNVLLIDCDLRDPSIHRALHVKDTDKVSLTELLLQQTTPDKVSVFKDPKLKFSFLPVGEIPPNPSELLGSRRMEKLLNAFDKPYDFVICDTPPVSVVTDAALLSSYCDGVLMVVRQNYADKEQVHTAIRNLEAVHANVMGVVLNQYDIEADIRSNKERYDYYYQY